MEFCLPFIRMYRILFEGCKIMPWPRIKPWKGLIKTCVYFLVTVTVSQVYCAVNKLTVSWSTCGDTFAIPRCHQLHHNCLARHMKVMDESFCLPWCRAELNWKLLFIPPVCRRRIRFVCNWFKPRGVFSVGKAKVFLFMEEMIEFILSCMPPCLLSFYPHPRQ